MRVLRAVCTIWYALRWAALLALYGVLIEGLTGRLAWRLLLASVALYLLGNALHRLRWPSFASYVRAVGPPRAPRRWQVGAGDSDSHVVWEAARPFVTRWVTGRQSAGHRILAAQGSAAGFTNKSLAMRGMNERGLGGSGGSLLSEWSADNVVDFVAACDAVAERLSASELATVRATGALPTWFWQALADQQAGDRVLAA